LNAHKKKLLSVAAELTLLIAQRQRKLGVARMQWVAMVFRVNENDMMNGTDYAGQDVTGWIVQEKFDGFRAFWTGEKLIARSGATINAPAWFTAGLPPIPLDCELYAGRGGLCKVQSVIRSKSGKWRGIMLVAFDSPSVVGGYELRHKSINTSLMPNHVFRPRLAIVENIEKAFFYFGKIKEQGGEGLMLRNPAAHYTPGRTTDLLKLKFK
jgi:DNA ligase 1